jgi:hypothetical protein
LQVPDPMLPAEVPSWSAPLLTVIVDTEEEFDWSCGFSRSARAVQTVERQMLMHAVFRPRGIIPTYVLDYPVAASLRAQRFFAELLGRGECHLGTHLHPWVNPPYEEAVCAANSYPGNLPVALERAKLEILGAAFEAAFGAAPRVYKAGRYGLGPATARLLLELGYEIDVSVVPHVSFAADGGPDFRGWPDQPFWFGPGARLLEVPVTRGFAGMAARLGPTLFPLTEAAPSRVLHLGGVAARLGLLERISLSPEGADFETLRRLTRALLTSGRRVFSFCYHSPSLAPGHTPYVRTPEDLRAFLDTAARFFDFFAEEAGGRFVTLEKLQRLLAGTGIGASRASVSQPAVPL